MALSLIQDTIDSLVDLAEQGAIDPWDVRVIEILDRYFQGLQTSLLGTTGKTAYDIHLSQSAQAFVSAALFVLLKANRIALEATDPDAFNGDDPDGDPDWAEVLTDEPAPLPTPKNLEQLLKRRGSPGPMRQRRVSLQEMIDQLQEVAEILAARPKRPPRQKRLSRSQKAKAIRHLAHQENLAETAAALEAAIAIARQDLFPHGPIPFDHLAIATTTPVPPSDDPDHPLDQPTRQRRHDRVGTLWGLLLLASQGKVDLQQDQFYGDIHIHPLAPPAPEAQPNTPQQQLELLPPVEIKIKNESKET
jgi:segregation and condensation protein A